MPDSIYALAPSRVTVLDRLLHVLLPAPCLGCARPLPARRTLLGLCARCRGNLARLPEEACWVCARPLTTSPLPAGYRCGSCRRHPPAFDRLIALWSYQPPLDAVVLGLKFGRLDYLGGHLAQALAEELGDRLLEHDLVVPIPLHWRRRLARGYNQAEQIARPLAARLGLGCAPLLARPRATPPQSLLRREERLKNLRTAFRARHPEKVRGMRILLVDDVATTGATLDAAAHALQKAGAASVTALAAGRTPLDPLERDGPGVRARNAG